MFGNRSFRAIEFVLALSLALIGISGRAWGQIRVYGQVQPNPSGTTNPLVFDINSEPSDNISPNIIINKDGQRGFVAYTGSGVVLEFSLVTGEVLNRISTGGMPFYATPLPDDRTLAIVSVLDSKIYLIDMNSNPSSLVGTYSFTRAMFGFGSIVTLSPDGTTGYISSTGTGEVIKFALSDGHEIGRIGGMRLPGQITVTPDGATLIVVDTDVGTPEVDFFDAVTFAKKGSLKNPNPATDVVAFTIFNKAVLAPDGKTGIIASHGQNNVLFKDLIFLFDATNGTILKTGETGSGPAWTGITPDGKKWVVLNMFSVTVIPTDNFDGLKEFQAANGEPLGSANVAITSDSRFGYFAASAHDLIFQIDLDTGANLDQILVGDVPDAVLEQPAAMAVTDDGKSIAALEFMSGNIDLFTPTTRVAGVKFLSSPDTFTGLSLINLSSTTNKVTLYAIQDFGEPNQETGVTNPVTLELAPNEQISRTVSEIFNFDDSNAPNGQRTGWLAIYAEQPEITGYLTIGKKDLTNLNGLTLATNLAHELIIPQIDRNGDATVELSSLNETYYNVSYELQRVAHDGSVLDNLQNQTAFPLNRLSQDIGDILPRTNLDTEGYLFLNSPEGLLYTEFHNNGTSIEAIHGIDINKFVGVNQIFAPHFANAPGWKTTLNLINASLQEADVTLTVHGPDGTVLGAPLQKHFKSGEQLKDDFVNIFADNPDALNAATGWLEVDSTQDQILGTFTFSAEDNHFAASFELSGTPLDQFLIPIVAQNDSYQTGLALLNSNTDPANVTLEVWGTDGTLAATATLTLNPQSRTAVYLDSLFPNMDPLLVGNLRVRSDKALYGFALLNDSGFNFLMPMPAIPLF